MPEASPYSSAHRRASPWPPRAAHQSVITPSVGLEQPRCTAWEPAFVQDLEWALLHALGRLGVADGESSYFRLSSRPVDQALAALPDDEQAREHRRQGVLAGGYPLRRCDGRPMVGLVGMGAIIPEVLAAADALENEGVTSDVTCLTSADLVFRAVQARRGLDSGPIGILEELFPPHRAAPLVAVLDGHPHTLSFLGSINRSPVTCLGVNDFGQSGEIDDLYRHFGIDTSTIIGAAWDLLDEIGQKKG